MQRTTDDEEVIIDEKGQMEPYILVTDSRAVLFVDCKIIGEVQSSDNYFISLISAYFVFNICYITGCNNFFSLFETVLFKSKPDKASLSVRHLLTALNQPVN